MSMSGSGHLTSGFVNSFVFANSKAVSFFLGHFILLYGSYSGGQFAGLVQYSFAATIKKEL